MNYFNCLCFCVKKWQKMQIYFYVFFFFFQKLQVDNNWHHFVMWWAYESQSLTCNDKPSGWSQGFPVYGNGPSGLEPSQVAQYSILFGTPTIGQDENIMEGFYYKQQCQKGQTLLRSQIKVELLMPVKAKEVCGILLNSLSLAAACLSIGCEIWPPMAAVTISLIG